jgi:outer membrane protein assembly factor BamB
MRYFFVFIVFLFATIFIGTAQTQMNYYKSYNKDIGISATSIKTITAKTYSLSSPIYDYQVDTASNQLIFSTRKKDPSGRLYVNKGFIAGLNCTSDSINWLYESLRFDLNLTGDFLLFSNETKTSRYDKKHGFEVYDFTDRIIYTIPANNSGLIYNNPKAKDELSCISLVNGAVLWTANLPRKEDWMDVKHLNDSLIIIAANGLHMININRGLIWSHSLITAEKNQKTLVYSVVNKSNVQKINSSFKTTTEDNLLSQLGSNILIDGDVIYFGGKEKVLAVKTNGDLLWQLDLKTLPISKMILTKSGSAITLINLGLSQFKDNYVLYGKPFVMNIDASNGQINSQSKFTSAENLIDFLPQKQSYLLADKKSIIQTNSNNESFEHLIPLDDHKFGRFVEFINGDEYYVEKEGYFVPLNFINDNVVYFKTENNKVYGVDKVDVQYEYHFTELFKREKVYKDKTVIFNFKNTLVINKNFELLATLNIVNESILMRNKMYFFGERILTILDMDDL